MEHRASTEYAKNAIESPARESNGTPRLVSTHGALLGRLVLHSATYHRPR